MIHPMAIISSSAEIDSEVTIGPYCVIGNNVKIGKHTVIGPHVVIEGPTTIGEQNRIFQFCSIGAEPQDLKFRNEYSECIIGNNTTLREYVTVNRGTEGGGGKTQLGSNILIMAYSHIAHDCTLHDNVIMANAATLAGHICIEECAILGGLVGVHQFVRIGAYAMIGGISGVSKDVPPYTMVVGDRARLRGLNLTGLKRRGFSPQAIAGLKSAYKLLFRSGLTTSRAIESIRADGEVSAEVSRLIDFIQHSKRGVIRE